MDMTMSLGWLGMFIGLLGFSAFWGWLMNALQEDIFARHKGGERETLENKLAVDEEALGLDHPSVATTIQPGHDLQKPATVHTGRATLQARAGDKREGARPRSSRCGDNLESPGRDLR